MKSDVFSLRIDAEFYPPIDEWRSTQRPIPSRSKAVRELILKGLEAVEAEGRTEGGAQG